MPSQTVGRRAPYAPISALHAFLAAIQNTRPPVRVDVKFLRGRAIARRNEYAFVSALKFLGVVDGRGQPTAAFRTLQRPGDASRESLANLVRVAYDPAFQAGALIMSDAALRQWFAANSSPSQASNALRFFRELCGVCGITADTEGLPPQPVMAVAGPEGAASGHDRGVFNMLRKVPGYAEWKGTPTEYVRVLEIWQDLFSRAGRISRRR